jgi:phosphoribosylaminoimidazolecarboxamide formyltransferase/IMP cyclohydrolase
MSESGPSIGKGRRDQYKTRVEEDFPEILELPRFEKAGSLRYGINPGVKAAFYREVGALGPNMANFKILQEGRSLGYINMDDMDVGQSLVKTLNDTFSQENIYCIIKHAMPSGVGKSFMPKEAFENAWYSDPLSSFGGVHVTNFPINEYIARQLIDKNKNVEVVYSPSFSPDALKILSERTELRVVEMSDTDEPSIDNGLDYKRLNGGMLVQERWHTKIRSPEDIECISETTWLKVQHQPLCIRLILKVVEIFAGISFLKG